MNKKKILFGMFLAIFLSTCFIPGTVYAASSGVTIPTDTGLPSGSLKTVIENFMKWILEIFGFLAIIAFVVSGIMYLTSGGDKERAESAKRQMHWSLIGVIVGLSGYVIIKAIESLLGGSSTTF